MKKFFICFGILLLLIFVFLIGKSCQNTGRYQIYLHPVIRADQYLLDTKTGKTWQMAQESKEKYMFWHEIPRDELPLSTEK